MPVDEFLRQNPEHADADENTLMFARIDHERKEREELEQQRQELLKRKAKLIADNKRRKEDLANLDNDLEKFIDVCYMLLLPCTEARLVQLQRMTNALHRRQNRSRSSWRRKHDGAVSVRFRQHLSRPRWFGYATDVEAVGGRVDGVIGHNGVLAW